MARHDTKWQFRLQNYYSLLCYFFFVKGKGSGVKSLFMAPYIWKGPKLMVPKVACKRKKFPIIDDLVLIHSPVSHTDVNLSHLCPSEASISLTFAFDLR